MLEIEIVNMNAYHAKKNMQYMIGKHSSKNATARVWRRRTGGMEAGTKLDKMHNVRYPSFRD